MASHHHYPEDMEFEFTFKVKAKVTQLADFFTHPEKLIQEGILKREDLKSLLSSLLIEELEILTEQVDWDVDCVSEFVKWDVTDVEEVTENGMG